MLIATDYPFLNILWTMIIFFAWVIWIWIAITVFIDVFRRRDIGGWSKALWVVFVIVIPFLGVLVYLIVNHDGMAIAAPTRPRLSSSSSTNTCVIPRAADRPRRDREGERALGQRRDQPGGVRPDQAERRWPPASGSSSSSTEETPGATRQAQLVGGHERGAVGARRECAGRCFERLVSGC